MGERCVLCGGPWHPATGQLIGSPTAFPCCGRCFAVEVVPLVRASMARTIRLSTPAKREALARRRAGDRRAQVPRVAFYDHVPPARHNNQGEEE